MKRNIVVLLTFIGLLTISMDASCQSAHHLNKLKIIIIRHGEKPPLGDNLNCQGINRSMLLPAVIKTKFGIPDYVYVPALDLGKSTSHSRMFQTIVPLVAKYNLPVNTKYEETDYPDIAEDVKSKTGTVLMVWEHNTIAPVVKALGVKLKGLQWPDEDFDSIWIVTFPNGVPTLTRDKEGLKPSADCNY